MRSLTMALLVLVAVPARAEGPTYTLADLVKSAEANNADLAAAREKITQAELAIEKAWSVLVPTLSLGAAYTRNSVEAVLPFPDFTKEWTLQMTGGDPAQGQIKGYLIPGGMVETTVQPLNQLGGQAQVVAPLFVMPAYEGIRIAKQAARATALGVSHGLDELWFALAQAYHGAVSTQRVIALSTAQLETARTAEKLAQARVDAGLAPRLDVVRAAADRSAAEQNLKRAENTHRAVLLAIAMLAGVDLPFELAPPTDDAPLPAGTAQELVGRALESRRDLAANRLAVNIAERAVDATWWRFLPVVAANADLRYANVAGFTGQYTTWLVQLAASVTLYDQSRYVDLDTAKSRVREAEANARAAERRIADEVQGALLDLESARANVVKAKEQQKLAEEGATLALAAYQAGTTTGLELTTATNGRFFAGINVVIEERAVQLAGIKLAKVMGRLGDLMPVPKVAIPAGVVD